MPVKQQYLIALSIVALVAVLVILAMFDFFGDRNRSTQALAMQRRGIASLPPRITGGAAPFLGEIEPRAVVPQQGTTSLPPPGPSANVNAPANIQCGFCGWAGRCMANGRCPNCYSQTNPALGQGGGPAQAGNTNFLWGWPQAAAPAPKQAILYCPQCNFRMNLNYPVASNSVRCPKCPAYLIGAGQPASAAVPPGQQAAYCPIR